MNSEIRMTNVEWPEERRILSPIGAKKYYSPEQHSGSPRSIFFSPEGAAHLRPDEPSHGTPLQGSGSFSSHVLGRCLRLAWAGPLALKSPNRQREVVA